MVGAHEPRLHERPIGGESKERQPDRSRKQAEKPERLAARRRLAPSAGEVKRQRETRNQQHREMNEDGAPCWREARQQVGIGIAGKQRRLEEHHRDRPDSGGPAQPWQHHLGEHRLDRMAVWGQPMFTKMVLPRLGGAAAVWSVAMVFFQATLLAGYAYAHLLARFAPGRGSVLIHLAVLLIACLALPLHLAGGWGQPPSRGEAFWLLGLFAASIGLPFFALAAHWPLMQAWFVRTDHPSARDPYFLFSASNLRSFFALISFPIVLEPFLRLGDQR